MHATGLVSSPDFPRLSTFLLVCACITHAPRDQKFAIFISRAVLTCEKCEILYLTKISRYTVGLVIFHGCEEECSNTETLPLLSPIRLKSAKKAGSLNFLNLYNTQPHTSFSPGLSTTTSWQSYQKVFSVLPLDCFNCKPITAEWGERPVSPSTCISNTLYHNNNIDRSTRSKATQNFKVHVRIWNTKLCICGFKRLLCLIT